MAVVVYPLDAVSGAPSYTGRMLRETLAVFLGGATAARPLGIRSGVRPGTPTTTISVSGTTVTIGEHAGAVDAEAAGEAGPYIYAVNAAFTQVLNAADATNPRTDAFGIRISDPAESDGTSTPGGALTYVAGTAGVGAPMPTLPTRFMLLGTASVPKSGAGSPTVSWVAPSLLAPGVATRLGSLDLGSEAVVTSAATWVDILSLTVTTLGGLLSVDWRAVLANANSGSTRTGQVRVVVDGTAIGPTELDYELPNGSPFRAAASYVHTSTPAAGTHTVKLQAQCSSANAISVKNAVMTVTEH